MKKLVLTYGLMAIVILTLSTVSTSIMNHDRVDGQKLVCNTSTVFVTADDEFSFDSTPVQKAITLFSCDFPYYNLYINTTPTFHLSPELLASSENGYLAVSRYSSSLKI